MANIQTDKNSDKNNLTGFLHSADEFFGKRLKFFFWLSFSALVLFSLLLFQVNISIGGDDSFYIIRAFRFFKYGEFPSFQGPLYPIFLVPFVALFGINVTLLKFLSLILAGFFIYLFYRTYQGRIGSTVLVLSLFILALNGEILYFASQTYNEMFHLVIQMLFLFSFFKLYDQLNGRDTNFKEDYKSWLIVGFYLFLLTVSKNLGLVGLLAVMAFFAIQFKWRSVLAALGSFAGFKLVFELMKRTIFGVEAQISKQGELLLYKDPYNYSKGKEDFMGFVDRLIENSNIYLSKNLMLMLDLRSDDVLTKIQLLTIVIYIFFGIGLIVAYKRNRIMFFTGLYSLITFLVVFVVLQARWDSTRLVFLVLPFFILFSTFTIDQLLKKSKFGFLQPLFFIIMIIYLGVTFFSSSGEIDLIQTKKNLAGEKYEGFTPDWQHYLKMSEWVSKNLPEDAYVAVRKPSMSFIYANGKEFHGISKVFSNDPDTLLDKFQEKGVTHVIMGKLRRNPKKKTQYTINTVHRYLATIEQKYRFTFQQVHQIGSAGDEEAILFEVDYSVRNNQ